MNKFQEFGISAILYKITEVTYGLNVIDRLHIELKPG